MGAREYERRGWERGEAVGDGNQGFTFVARKNDGAKGDWPYVLKRLKRQKDDDARRRMHIEVATLETLDHPGVVQLIESNAHDFDSGADLFLVTCRVMGSDLDQLVADNGPLTVKDGVEIIDAVLGTLEFCHSKRVIHRDIKPCHIILRDGVRTEPVLIDFGLSFNEEIECVDGSTASHVGVGNRFIGLPEQQPGGSDKRDARSDVTQCVGVLFFLLTGETPRFIRDSSERKPHERIDLTQAIANLNSEQAIALRRIFDIGFEYDPRRRWQSAAALKKEIRSLVGQCDVTMDLDTRLDDLSARLAKSPAVAEQAQLISLEKELIRRLISVAQCAQEKLAEHVMVQPSFSEHLSSTASTYPMNLGFVVTTASRGRQVHLYHTCHAVGSELVLRRDESISEAGFFSPDQHSTEVLRIGVFDPAAVEQIIQVIESALIETIESVFDAKA